MVCVPFSLSPLIFFHKARAWVVLSLGLKRKKVWVYGGLKTELGLTPCKAQGVGLRAFVSPRRAFKNSLGLHYQNK